MAVKKRAETVDLGVQPNEKVFLTVTIGNAQIGGNVVKFKGSPDTIGKGEIENPNLGSDADLIGKTLKVTTNILDVNEQTNGIVVTYFISGCNPPAIMFHDTVNNDGDIFSFLVDFNFK